MNKKKKAFRFLGEIMAIFSVFLLIVSVPASAVQNPNVSQSQIEITDFTIPEGQLKAGSYFIIKGKITSEQKLKSVSVGIYYRNNISAGQFISVSPEKTDFDLNTIDETIYFDILPEGLYRYKVIAEDVSGYNKVLVESDFQIGNKSAESKITLSNEKFPSGKLEKGTECILKADITSVQPLFTVESKIINVDSGETFYSFEKNFKAEESPLPTSYSISSENNNTFNIDTLDAGKYKYSLTVSDYTGFSVILTETDFEIIVPEIIIPDDADIKISDYTAPTGNLEKGAFFNIKGTITSTYNLKNVYASISGGKTQQFVEVSPDGKTYNLFPDIDYGLLFDKLDEGFYTYTVIAEDINGYTATLISSDFTVGKPKVLLGDADNDGEITIADSVAVAVYVSNPNIVKLHLPAADINNDGISANDAFLIQLFVTGNIDDLSVYSKNK